MKIPREDDSLETTLSLVDELVLDGSEGDGLPSLYADEGWQTGASRARMEGKARRRAEYNERRKMLRRAGVYSDPNRARKARTKEITDLRALVEKLQVDLKVLQSHGSREKPATHQHAVISTSRIPDKSQEIANIQWRRLVEAEHHNTRLRLALKSQQEVGSRLYKVLRKRATQLTNECSSLISLVCAKSYMVDVLDFPGDVCEYQDLLRRLDVAYQDIDAVFAENGLNVMAVAPCDVHIREDACGKYLELFSYKVLPFDVRSTTEAAWNHFKGIEKHLGNGSIYKKAEKVGGNRMAFNGIMVSNTCRCGYMVLDEPYTIVADFTKEVFSNNSKADIKVKQVVRRYMTDRDIIIWVARARPTEIKHKMLRGLTYRSRGYAVTQRFPGSTPDRELSVLQQCSRISLDHEGGTTYSYDDVRTLTNFLIANAAQNMRVPRELIENALIDQGRARCLA